MIEQMPTAVSWEMKQCPFCGRSNVRINPENGEIRLHRPNRVNVETKSMSRKDLKLKMCDGKSIQNAPQPVQNNF